MKCQRHVFLLYLVLFSLFSSGCRAQAGSYTADVSSGLPNGLSPRLSGKLYLAGDHVRIDWGVFADVFDRKQRKGWRIQDNTKTYQELGSKDLSTYVPEMTDASLCPHTQVPSECKLMSSEVIDGRSAKKWDVYSPNGFHVYFWTDEKLGITLRMAMGETTAYQVTNFSPTSVSESMFRLPSGYEKVDRPIKR
jgi:hypothetical protein